jgi:hypothetical protein
MNKMMNNFIIHMLRKGIIMQNKNNFDLNTQ